MKLPEGYLPREGDVVLVHATVRFDVDPGEPNVHIRIAEYDRGTSIPLEKIEGLHSRVWKKGETVVHDGNVGTVIAVCEDQVWVQFVDSYETLLNTELNPVPPPLEEEPAAIQPPPPDAETPILDKDGKEIMF